MDAITLMMILFLNLNEPCQALPLQDVQIKGIRYQILTYSCGAKLFQVWQRYCLEGQGFWSRPFYLEEQGTGYGFYLDQFAELHAARRAQLNEVYIPRCGT